MDTPDTQIYDWSLSWHGTAASIKIGGVELVLRDQTCPLSEMMRSSHITVRIALLWEEFEDTKGVIRIRKSKKDR